MQSIDDSGHSPSSIRRRACKPTYRELLPAAAGMFLGHVTSWSRGLRLAAFLPLWSYRYSKSDPTAPLDGILLFALLAWSTYIESGFNDEYFWCAIFPFVYIYLNVQQPSWLGFGLITRYHDAPSEFPKNQSDSAVTERHGRPMLFPCRTTHARMFPEKHSFSYSYLHVGFPVGWRGCSGSVLSVDPPKDAKRGWFHVQASDHLERGGDDQTLEEKLSSYLDSQGVSNDEWACAYFVTAPRFLGYSFNPVSFWYLYSAERELKMMILEVNNTFDERRMYLLKATDEKEQETTSLARDTDGKVLPTPQSSIRFTNAWAKEFHVSPFNSIRDSYSLIALDPLSSAGESVGTINNTVTLKSSKEHAELVARVFSVGAPIDPESLGWWASLRFLVSWGWVGFVTFPRILREAWKLYFERRLPVWFRPEISIDSIGRRTTDDERLLEPYFEKYLAHLVEHAPVPLIVVYKPPSEFGPPRQYASPHVSEKEEPRPRLHIHVTTPAFYSPFVHYAHTTEAFDRECLCTLDKNRTLRISQPELLQYLLPRTKPAMDDPPRLGFLDGLRWAVLRRLRCLPASPSYPYGVDSSKDFTVEDIRALPLSPMDVFVQRNAKDAEDAWRYRRCLTKLFLAQRFAFGLAPLVTGLDVLVRFAILAMAIRVLFTDDFGMAQRSGALGMFFGAAVELLKAALLNGVHLWALAKGV